MNKKNIIIINSIKLHLNITSQISFNNKIHIFFNKHKIYNHPTKLRNIVTALK